MPHNLKAYTTSWLNSRNWEIEPRVMIPQHSTGTNQIPRVQRTLVPKGEGRKLFQKLLARQYTGIWENTSDKHTRLTHCGVSNVHHCTITEQIALLTRKYKHHLIKPTVTDRSFSFKYAFLFKWGEIMLQKLCDCVTAFDLETAPQSLIK